MRLRQGQRARQKALHPSSFHCCHLQDLFHVLVISTLIVLCVLQCAPGRNLLCQRNSVERELSIKGWHCLCPRWTLSLYILSHPSSPSSFTKELLFSEDFEKRISVREPSCSLIWSWSGAVDPKLALGVLRELPLIGDRPRAKSTTADLIRFEFAGTFDGVLRSSPSSDIFQPDICGEAIRNRMPVYVFDVSCEHKMFLIPN
jgi:hypothetical protein